MGNLPPNIQLDTEVITYYHSPLYLENPVDFPIKERIKYALKRRILRKFIKNSNTWWVQTELIKEKFQEKFEIETSKVGLMPFYPPFGSSKKKTVREEKSFLYVSNATVHKNHIRLIDAFCAFFDKYKTAKLTLTVSDSYREIVDLIERRISEGYPIINVGFIGRKKLQMLYLSSEYLIFPSLAESFGLGMVEAIDNGCKVIGADLEYTYAVCEPSLVFNPYEVSSISEALGRAIDEETGLSKSRMSNKITELVTLLQ